MLCAPVGVDRLQRNSAHLSTHFFNLSRAYAYYTIPYVWSTLCRVETWMSTYYYYVVRSAYGVIGMEYGAAPFGGPFPCRRAGPAAAPQWARRSEWISVHSG